MATFASPECSNGCGLASRAQPIRSYGDNDIDRRLQVIRNWVEPAASPGMVRYAESESELSYRDATGTSTMTETVATDSPPVAKPSRTLSRKPATVSASALALHLDCSRTYIGKLEAEGVVHRQGDGFPLDQSRVAYLRYLRRERQQSPRAAADADHVKVKTEMLQLRLMEKKRELVRREDVDALIDGICGVTLTALSSMPARCAPRGDPSP
jgi:hypothetical protein